MKTLTLYATLALTLVACGSGGTTPAPPAKSVNDITLTTRQLSVPLAGFEAGHYTMRSVLVGNSIYFANHSNTPKNQFFVRYDLASSTFSAPLAKSANVCGCGYDSKLVSDGTNIFYIANDATKYTVSTNTWSDLSYPASAKDNAGEAGVVYRNGSILFVGGRNASTLFKAYSIAQDKWFTGPNYLYATNESELAAYKDKLFVLGGKGATTKVSSFNFSTENWTALKDAPFKIKTSSSDTYSAVLGDYLYLLQDKSIYIYDFNNDVWASNPIPVTSLGGSYNNLFSNGSKLYIAGKNSSNVPQVYEITVGVK